MNTPTRLGRRSITLIAIYFGIPLVALVLFLVISVSQVNDRERRITEDLRQAGYSVTDVDALEYRAVLEINGRDVDVLIREDGAGYAPYVDCPVLPDGNVSDKQCAPLPIP